MRLTLRTMLAYLDDILEPADAQELGKKIQESKYASELVHRVRSSLQRLRLGAPKLEGKGMGLDPNTVAEYLDNTLAADRVPDLEKVCLESDVHLAEVAACHQILTLVLGEPADVPPQLRERIYRLATLDIPAAASKADTAAAEKGTAAAAAAVPAKTGANGSKAGVKQSAGAAAAAEKTGPEKAGAEKAGAAAAGTEKSGAEKAAASAAAAAADPQTSAGAATEEIEAPPKADSQSEVEAPPVEEPIARSSRGRPEVPDYLRATRRPSIWPVALTLLLVFGLAIVGLRVMGPFDKTHPLAKAFGVSGQQTASNAQGNAAGKAKQPSNNDGTPARKPSEPAPKQTDTPDGDEGAPGGGEPETASPDLPGEDAVRVIEPKPAVAPADVPSEPPVPPNPREGVPPAPDAAPAGAGALIPPVEPGTTEPDKVGAGTLESPPAGEDVDVGRFISDEQVLAVEKADGTWLRLPPHATLVAGERLLTLPSYRPQIAMLPSMQVTFSGPTMADLGTPLRAGIPLLHIEYGRALIVTAGRADAQIALRLGDRMGVVTFSTADTTMAVDVSNYLPPGANPEPLEGGPNPAITISRIYATQGRIEWEEAGGTVAVNAGQVRLLAGDAMGRTVNVETMPTWFSPSVDERSHDNSSELALRLASRTLEPYLKPETPIRLTLNEQLESQKVEVRSLAIRCLSYLSQFEPFVDELNDARMRSYWDDAFDALQAAIARSPDTARELRTALETQRGGDAAELYRMLWGYSPEQLERGGAAQLVEYLSHERMDFRVLAFENLRRITGKTLYYRPELLLRKNQPYLLRWEKLLGEGGIVYEKVPTPLPELEDVKMPMPPGPLPAGAADTPLGGASSAPPAPEAGLIVPPETDSTSGSTPRPGSTTPGLTTPGLTTPGSSPPPVPATPLTPSGRPF